MLNYLVEKDFPDLIELAKKRGQASDDPDALQALIFALLRAGNEEEAKQLLSQ